MTMSDLHRKLTDLAHENGGWEVGVWKAPMRVLLQSEPWKRDADGLTGYLGNVKARPDAWRISREGRAEGWGHDVLVLEFLEVEVGHRIDRNKLAEFANIFWMFDATDRFHFRAWKMDRFGIMSPAMNEQIAYQVLAQS